MKSSHSYPILFKRFDLAKVRRKAEKTNAFLSFHPVSQPVKERSCCLIMSLCGMPHRLQFCVYMAAVHFFPVRDFTGEARLARGLHDCAAEGERSGLVLVEAVESRREVAIERCRLRVAVSVGQRGGEPLRAAPPPRACRGCPWRSPASPPLRSACPRWSRYGPPHRL